MLLASLQNVTKRYGVQPVLQGASMQISTGQKLGLIGPNGSGKTTILRILLGTEPATGGSVFVDKGARIGYIPQYVEYEDNDTVLDHVLADHRRLSEALQQQEERLATASEDEMPRVFQAYEKAREAYDRVDGDHLPQRAGAMLDALGLGGKQRQKIDSLSGGEKNVLALTEALLAEPDLLVLDEPANHLDYLGVAWLEDFLNRFGGAVLIVSHNRYLLDRTVEGIFHLEGGRITYYDGGYSDYRATRLRHLLAQQQDYIANQKRLAMVEARVKRFEQLARAHPDPKWGRRLRSQCTQLAREKRNAVGEPVLQDSAIQATFHTETTRASVALQIRGYSKAFGAQKLFDSVDLDVSCGEHVALIGPNGSGKTTLLRDVMAHGDWESNVIRIGPSLSVGYCSQGQESLDPGRTMVDELQAAAPMNAEGAFAVLRRFLFTRDDLYKRVEHLSGGERNRLQLAKLMVLKPNFLILDEPTNHLDIQAREAVEEALEDFKGTLLVVSHDRYFLDKVIHRVIEIRDCELVSFPGNFTEFWVAREKALARVVGRISQRSRHRKQAESQPSPSKQLATLERRILEAEQQKQELEQQITDAFDQRNHREGRRASKQLERVKEQIDMLYKKWLELSA